MPTMRIRLKWSTPDSRPRFAREEVTFDPYALVNLYTEYRLPAFRTAVFADIRNLLDTGFTEVYGFNTARFNIKGGVRVAL